MIELLLFPTPCLSQSLSVSLSPRLSLCLSVSLCLSFSLSLCLSVSVSLSHLWELKAKSATHSANAIRTYTSTSLGTAS